MPWATLSSLFSLSPNAVENTESEIDRLLGNESVPFLAILKIFIQIFKQNEGLTAHRIFNLHDLQNALQQVPITDTRSVVLQTWQLIWTTSRPYTLRAVISRAQSSITKDACVSVH